MSVIEQIEGLLRCVGGGDATDDFDDVVRWVDRSKRTTGIANMRNARRLCVEQRARLRWPDPSPEVQTLLDERDRQRQVLASTEDRWAVQTSPGQPGQVRNYRREQRAETKATMVAQMQASVAVANAKTKSKGKAKRTKGAR